MNFGLSEGACVCVVILCTEYLSNKSDTVAQLLCCNMWTLNCASLFCRSGWRRSRDGCWVKDENAEFDSDEDAPDV